MIHALCSASNLPERAEKIKKKPLFKQTHKVRFHIITSLGVVFSLSRLISKLSRSKIISLRGRHLKEKEKGVLGTRSVRGGREGGKPPSLRVRRVSLAPKTPFPFPFKRLPRRLENNRKFHIYIAGFSLIG